MAYVKGLSIMQFFIIHRYYDGFPLLDHNLFFTPPTEQPLSPNIDSTQKDDSSSMIMVRSTAEKSKGKQAAEAAHGNAEVWAKYVFVTC